MAEFLSVAEKTLFRAYETLEEVSEVSMALVRILHQDGTNSEEDESNKDIEKVRSILLNWSVISTLARSDVADFMAGRIEKPTATMKQAEKVLEQYIQFKAVFRKVICGQITPSVPAEMSEEEIITEETMTDVVNPDKA
ncbi:hypothetical protein [Fervidobacterium sp.]